MQWLIYGVLGVALLCVALLALAWVQGVSARRSAMMRGVLPDDRPQDTDYQNELIMLGDSAFSGVSLEYWREGVASQLGRLLGEGVTCLAQPGWSSAELHEAVAKLFLAHPDASPQYAVICIGLNDTFRLIPARKTVDNIERTVALLQAKQRDLRLLVMGLPPIYELEALSWPLSSVLRWRIGRVNRLLYPAMKQANHEYLSVPPMSAELVASDGLHPSARAHMIMAETIVRRFAHDGATTSVAHNAIKDEAQ